MRVFSRIYRAVAAALCLLGLGIQFGVHQGQFSAYLLNYFTVLSNIVCLIMWVALLAKPRLSPVIHGIAAQGILLTMTVYHFMLSGQFTMGDGGMNLFQFANILLHYVCPTLMIIDLLFLAQRQPLKASAPWIWAVFPIVYLVFVFIRGATGIPIAPGGGSAYPYFFLDPGAAGFTGHPQGFGGVAIWVALLFAAYVLAGYVMRTLYLLAGKLLKRPSL